MNPRRIVTCLNVVSVTNSKRLTTKLQRRIRKNSKYLILNPESNLGCEQEVARKPGTPPLASPVRALSLARFALARSLCAVLHLPASLTSRAALTCHSHRPAPSMCPSSPRSTQMPALAELIVCTARASRSSLHSSCVWQASPSFNGSIFMVKGNERKKKAASTTWKRRGKTGRRRRSSERPRSSRDPFACCPACAHTATAVPSSASSHALLTRPWQCHLTECLSCAMPCVQ